MVFVEHYRGIAPRLKAQGMYLGGGKRGLDVAVTLVLLPIWLPLVAVLWILALLETGSGGYADLRVGRNGQRFACLKIRTLRRHVSRRCAAEKPFLDSRATPLGRFLRRASLDELPQFWCVLKGEMSLVGPRPVPENELSRYGSQRSVYLQMRPGLSGLWQVSGRNGICYSRRIALDVEYCRTVSFTGDLRIIGATVLEMLKLSGR